MKYLLAVASLSLLLQSASATTIEKGQVVQASYIDSHPIEVLDQYVREPFSSVTPDGSTPLFTGSYVALVYKDSSNTLCNDPGNCLSFGIQVKNDASSTTEIERITTGPFSDEFAYNVGYTGNPVGAIPTTISYSDYGAIGFNFIGIYPGSVTQYLIVQSSATAYTLGNVSLLDSQSVTVGGFVPTSVTPEPSSLLLLSSGLFLIGFVLKSKLA